MTLCCFNKDDYCHRFIYSSPMKEENYHQLLLKSQANEVQKQKDRYISGFYQTKVNRCTGCLSSSRGHIQHWQWLLSINHVWNWIFWYSFRNICHFSNFFGSSWINIHVEAILKFQATTQSSSKSIYLCPTYKTLTYVQECMWLYNRSYTRTVYIYTSLVLLASLGVPFLWSVCLIWLNKILKKISDWKY